MAFYKKLFYMFSIILTLFILIGCVDTEPDLSDQSQVSSPPTLLISVNVPVLKISYQDRSIDAKRGTYSWTIDNNDGTGTGIDADTVAPPELVKGSSLLTVPPKASLTINFSDKPTEITVNIWKDNEPIEQPINDDEIVVPELNGLVIYEVIGTWKQGFVHYAFSVNVN